MLKFENVHHCSYAWKEVANLIGDLTFLGVLFVRKDFIKITASKFTTIY